MAKRKSNSAPPGAPAPVTSAPQDPKGAPAGHVSPVGAATRPSVTGERIFTVKHRDAAGVWHPARELYVTEEGGGVDAAEVEAWRREDLRADYERRIEELRQRHEATVAELRKLMKERRGREPTIPWSDIDGLMMGRIGRHGVPDDLPAIKGERRAISARQILIGWLEEAARVVEATPSKTSLANHADLLLRRIAEGERRWARQRNQTSK